MTTSATASYFLDMSLFGSASMALPQWSFSGSGPTVCDSLSPALRDYSLSLKTFNEKLKTYLFPVEIFFVISGAVIST